MKPLVINDGSLRQLPEGEVLDGHLCAARLVAGSQSIAAGGLVAVTFSSAPIETHDQFSGALPLNLSITVSGVYLVGYQATFAAAAPLLQARLFRLGDIQYGETQAENSAALSGSALLALTVGDVIRLQVAHGAASARTLSSAALWAARLG